MFSLNSNIFVLDATAFIRLDFPLLLNSQTFNNAVFYSPPGVISELKDFRSKMNLEILDNTERLRIYSPEPRIIHNITEKIQEFDPQTSLSTIDIEVIALSIQLRGTIISNDFAIQNIAYHLEIPFMTMSGRKIVHPRRWYLKCQGCGKKVENHLKLCPFCGNQVKKSKY